MKIVDFTYDHIEQAKIIAKANYEEERQCVLFLIAEGNTRLGVDFESLILQLADFG